MNKWFGNEIIETYLAMMLAGHPSNEFLPAHIFYLFQMGENINKRWADKIDLEQIKVFFFPLHINGDHWALGVLNRQRNTFEIFDSFNHRVIVDYSKSYIKDQLRRNEKGVIIYTKNEIVYFVIKYFEELYKFKGKPYERPNILEDLKIPQQENLNDCGVFTLMYAYYNVENVKFNREKFTKKAVDIFRRKIIYEIDMEEL